MTEAVTAQDRAQLMRALELAALGLYTTDPNPRVGCVITNSQGGVLGEGWHARAGEPHAEVFALRAAGALSRGATAYVTLEPCSHTGRTPPCADALIAAGVARVVCCTRDPNPKVAGGGIERLRQAGIAVDVGGLSIADTGNSRLVELPLSGSPYVITLLNPTAPPPDFSLNTPAGVTLLPTGDLLVSDTIVGLGLAHSVLALPFVVVILQSGLREIGRGAGPVDVFDLTARADQSAAHAELAR